MAVSDVKLKLLVLTARYPYPVIGGDRLRIIEICRSLSNSYDLTLLSLCETKLEMDSAKPDDSIFTEIHRVYLPRWKSIFNVLIGLLGSEPLQVCYYKSAQFKTILDSLLPKNQAVVAHLARTGACVKNCSIPTVVEMTDAISLNYARSAKVGVSKSLLSLVYAIERKRIGLYEKTAPDAHSLVSFVSAVDAEYLYGKSLPSNVVVCGNGVDVANFDNVESKKKEPVVAFVGNMSSMQNRDAAYWFGSEVLPILRKVDQGFKFRIVGAISEQNKKRFETIDGVEVTGKVGRVVDYLSDCFAGVCSVRIGAGVQNKLLEYMAVGLPAVTTSMGLEGVGAVDGEELWVADSPTEFAEKLLYIWQNPEEAKKVARQARYYVEKNHVWSKVLAPFVQSVDRVLSR